jgi:hypothetical protein
VALARDVAAVLAVADFVDIGGFAIVRGAKLITSVACGV